MTNDRETDPNELLFGDWVFNVDDNSLKNIKSQRAERLEPRVGDLLRVLLRANHAVVSKETLMSELWPNVVVGDDTLAKTVSRLRAVLGEKASSPNLIETIPKRGYRLKESQTLNSSVKTVLVKTSSLKEKNKASKYQWLVPVLGVMIPAFLFVGWWLSSVEDDGVLEEKLNRADGLYMKFEEQSNEAALALYEDVLKTEQTNSHAQAGVANSMVQRVVRWPEGMVNEGAQRPSLTSALASGQLSTPEAKLMLERARLMAEKAVRESPQSTQALKALGFVYSAEGKLDRAIEQYQRAIAVDDKEWRSMINLAELLSLSKQPEAALETFTQAYYAMQSSYEEEPQHIGPWQPSVGVVIAQMYQQLGDYENALSWAKTVLELEPFERDASNIYLSASLATGQPEQAKRFCESYASKLESPVICLELLK